MTSNVVEEKLQLVRHGGWGSDQHDSAIATAEKNKTDTTVTRPNTLLETE